MSNLQINTRVRRLFQYLNDFEMGKILVPPFQRDFVWKNDKKIELLDSLKNGYPIGSVLFWQPSQDTKNNLLDDELQIIGGYFLENNQPEGYYILDGYQRLSTLFGCFIDSKKTHLRKDEKFWKNNFDIIYNLKDDKFEFNRKTKSDLEIFQVPLYYFTDGDNFYDFSMSLMNLDISENEKKEFINRYKNFGAKISSYDIPSIDLIGGSIKEAVEIFSRLNSRGETISDDWKVSALSFNKERNFRFGSEIDDLFNRLATYNFFKSKEEKKAKRNLVLQCVLNTFDDNLIYFDVANTSSKLEELASNNRFIDVSRKAFVNIEKAIKFLNTELFVLDGKLLPYNSQLIFITDFFSKVENPTLKQIEKLKEWFWITTYSNYFTNYNLSGQRSAYNRFQKFINDENIDPVLYLSNEIFECEKFPPKISMGSVRAKALALFMINYSINYFDNSNLDSKNKQGFVGYKECKLLPVSHNASENSLFILQSDSKNSYFDSNRKDFSSLLSLDYLGKFNEYFINDEMRIEFSEYNAERVLSNRKELIQYEERNFVEKLGITYRY